MDRSYRMRQVLGDGAEDRDRHEHQETEDHDHRPEREPEGGESAPQRPRRLRCRRLGGEGAGERQGRDDGDVAARGASPGRSRDVPEGRVVPQPLEAGAVVGRGRAELVEHLGEPVGARVLEPGRAPSPDRRSWPRRSRRWPVPTRIASGWSSSARLASFISLASTFFPRNSGVRPIIMPATNTVTMMKISMLMKPTPTPPKMLLSHMPIIGTRPAERRQRVVHAVDRAVRGHGGRRGPERGEAGAEADLLALHGARGLVDPHGGDGRVAPGTPGPRAKATRGR